MKITIVSSSTRIGRVSHRIALALKSVLTDSGAEVGILDLNEVNLPPFAERLSHLDEPPEELVTVMESLQASDGLVFLTPEYNGAPSSGLKNFIDVFAKAGFSEKPIGTATGSTGAMGGIRAAYMVQQMILSINAYPHPRMLTVGKMDQVLGENGEFTEEKTESRIRAYAETYLDWVKKLSA